MSPGEPFTATNIKQGMNLITSGLDVAQDMICSSIPDTHLLLSWTDKWKVMMKYSKVLTVKIHLNMWATEQPPSPWEEPFHLWAQAPGQAQRRSRGRWRPVPGPLPPWLWSRSSPAKPTHWRSRWLCQTRVGSVGGEAAQEGGTGVGPGGGLLPGTPGIACKGCGQAAPRILHGAGRWGGRDLSANN